MKGKIGIKDYHISCVIGDLPHERHAPQSIYVDVEIETDFSLTDKLEGTYCYVQIANICNEIATQQNFRLLETFAGVLLERLMSEPKIQSAWVRVKKPSAISSAEYAYVEVRSS